jgi:hypothetical protein
MGRSCGDPTVTLGSVVSRIEGGIGRHVYARVAPSRAAGRSRTSTPTSGTVLRRSCSTGCRDDDRRATPQFSLRVSHPGDIWETEADHISRAVTDDTAPGPQAPTLLRMPADRLHLQRCGSMCRDACPCHESETVGEALRSPWQPLDDGTRQTMETRLGHDFSQVRVHTDAAAARSAAELGARAYTVGSDVVFGAGRYAPQASSGQRLLTHELVHVIQQRAGAPLVQRDHDAGTDPTTTTTTTQPAPPTPAELTAAATTLETDILADPAYKKLATESRNRVQAIIAKARTKPPGTAKGQRGYYLAKLKIAITTPFEGKETGKAEYGCSDTAEKINRERVSKALTEEAQWGGYLSDLDETVVATGTKAVKRMGQRNKTFTVDASDPRNIRVKIKVHLIGKPDEVKQIKGLEDAIERAADTKGYWLDVVFVDTDGPDIFPITVSFCLWANSGNWASGPITLSHEVHHALGLDDRYDYIESHAANPKMNAPMRLIWFEKQMDKVRSARDDFSKMATSSNPLLSEDVCAVAFPPGAERKKCIDARKDLDPANVPAP